MFLANLEADDPTGRLIEENANLIRITDDGPDESERGMPRLDEGGW